MRPERFRATAAVVALFLSGSCATASQAPAAVAPAAASAAGRPNPYLTPAATPQAAVFLLPPPAVGSPAGQADEAAFNVTRALQSSPRWAMAAADVPVSPTTVRRFACAVGADLTPENAPNLYHLLGRMRRDQSVITNTAKDIFRRPRPFLSHEGAPICEERTEELTGSFAYPSGHSTYGFSMALVLAELAPDRATEIIARGRAYGDSRVVCGVHWSSDVMAGRVTAAALVSRLHAEPAFQTDLAAARAEVASARAQAGAAPDPAACQAEAALVANPGF